MQSKINWAQKLSSRKWVTVGIVILVMVCVIFNRSASDIERIVAAVVSGLTGMVGILAESRIDAARAAAQAQQQPAQAPEDDTCIVPEEEGL